MNDPCEVCLNNVQDEYGSYYCAEGGSLDEDEMARYAAQCDCLQKLADEGITARETCAEGKPE